jgi:hypothetical protein
MIYYDLSDHYYCQICVLFHLHRQILLVSRIQVIGTQPAPDFLLATKLGVSTNRHSLKQAGIRPVGLDYQPPASSTFLSAPAISHQPNE